LNISSNRFTFEDIEPNIGIENISYASQSLIGEEQTITINEGASYTFFVHVGGEHNNYQWYKNDVVIADATNPYYSIDELSLKSSGDYNCHITNSIANGLTLYSYPIHLLKLVSI